MPIITKNNTLEIKGTAILCMIFYHLFAFPERIPESVVSSWMGNGITKSFQICVSVFIFMAGYGLQCTKTSLSLSNCFNRLRKLYINYWWATIPFIIIGFCIQYYPLNFRISILNIVGFESTFNGEWWFYSLYIELLIIFYTIIGRLNFNHKSYILFMISLLFFVGIIYIIIPFDLSKTWERHTFLIIRNINIFTLGCYFAKFVFFTHYNNSIIKYSIPFFIIFPLLVRGYLPLTIVTDLFLIPIFIIGVINLPDKLKKILQYFGKHSMNIWLIHSFFIYHYCKSITFITSNPIIMYFTVTLCSLGCSIAIIHIKNFKFDKYNQKFIQG